MTAGGNSRTDVTEVTRKGDVFALRSKAPTRHWQSLLVTIVSLIQNIEQFFVEASCTQQSIHSVLVTTRR